MDNKNIWNHERLMAESLQKAGYEVIFKRRDDRNRSADAYINGILFEFKSPKGKNIDCVERNLKRAVHQSENIVIYSGRIKNIQDRSIRNRLIARLRLGHGVKRILFIDRHGVVIDINGLI